MADATLGAIRTKFRRLTRSPSTSQISDATIDEYVNTFILYDFPEHLRLFSLRTTFKFYTTPYVDTYETLTLAGASSEPMYQFKDRVVTVHEPVYIAGFPAYYQQSRQQFYGIYPIVNNILTVGQNGDGVSTNFTGTLSQAPVLQNNVTFTSIGANNTGLALKDVPVVDATTGVPTTTGNLYVPDAVPATPPTVVLANNNINYVTGAFDITFPSAPATGEQIVSETVPYVAARPESLLYFDNKFVVRPVPDRVYPVQMEVYIRPTELMSSASVPELEQWWQYIAVAASVKFLQDRVDFETANTLMPLLKEQETLVLRRTIVQQTNERSATIYTEQTGLNAAGYFGWFGGPL